MRIYGRALRRPEILRDMRHVALAASKGMEVMLQAGWDSGMPTTAEAQKMGEWARVFGPGGTYALRFKSAYDAMQATNPAMGLLAQADDGNCGCDTWVRGMHTAVPNLGSIVAGWTVHPYGPVSRGRRRPPARPRVARSAELGNPPFVQALSSDRVGSIEGAGRSGPHRQEGPDRATATPSRSEGTPTCPSHGCALPMPRSRSSRSAASRPRPAWAQRPPRR